MGIENKEVKVKNQENKLLIAKIEDKIEFCITKNKIVYTDFLNMAEKSVVQKHLKEIRMNNYIFYGVKEESDRSILVIYPEKLDEELVKNNCKNILEIIRIKLPKDIKYEHGDYLSGIMKLGVKREKFGDIIVNETGADIIILKEISEYLLINLKDLTRFKKSDIHIIDISELADSTTSFEDISIIVSSMRLDNLVSELARCSRTKATEVIEEARVFINSVNEFKLSKKIDMGDIITIRGKGKFRVDSIEKETKGGRIVLNIKKYV